MSKTRLEAFSDGVIAIIITIMALELKIPHGNSWWEMVLLCPLFFSYILSFVFIGIYWNNHHHLLHAARSVNGRILWANMHLLFWLSLVPFATGWMGENAFAPVPVAVYGMVLLFAACAYFILSRQLITHHGQDSVLARAVGRDVKGKISVVLYGIAIPLALWQPGLACSLYVIVALIWLVPDRRIERVLAEQSS